jgi:dTDP-4-dehydrorhamnose reductase
MLVFVAGAEGQLARSLTERVSGRKDVSLIHGARPAFDLLHPDDVEATVVAAKPDLVINAAAYTAVDKAEAEADLAFGVNDRGAAALAKAAAHLAVPIIHISTDYVYSGQKTGAYVETDATGPLGVYGQSKLAGEQSVAEVNPWHVILRTSWVYSPFGSNFVKTMLRLGGQRDSLGIVADQVGNPTSALDLAHCVLAVAARLLRDKDVSGVYLAAGTGTASWFEFASEIFNIQSSMGYRVPVVSPIQTSDYPTPAHRPANSRLDCSKLKTTFGYVMPPWQLSLRDCMSRLRDEAADGTWRLK